MENFIYIITFLGAANLALSQTCSILYNVDYYGNDLFAEPTNLPSWDDCCALCTKTIRCTAWTYMPISGACWLKYGFGNVRTVSPGPVFSGIVKTTISTTASTASPVTTFSTIFSTTPSTTVVPINTASNTAATNDCNAEFNAAALEAHNTYRALHQAPPLTLDPKITSVATDYSQKLAFEINSLVHSSSSGYGENLAWISGGSTSNNNCADLARKFVKMWYDEVAFYDYNNPGFSSRKNYFLIFYLLEYFLLFLRNWSLYTSCLEKYN